MDTCIAEEMGNGELCDVHVKSQKRISERNELIAREQGSTQVGIEDFIHV